MERLLYISESRIKDSDAKPMIAQIVAASQIRNTKLAITGALLFTGTHFAQILEGPTESIDLLMVSINADLRQGNILIADRSAINTRRFPDWKMAYHGPSLFVSRQVVRLLHRTSQSEQRRATEWLTELAHEFSTAVSPGKMNDKLS